MCNPFLISASKNFPSAARILIFRGGALGDFLLTFPVFRFLRQTWPQADITLVGIPHIAELARIAGLVNRVLAVDCARFAAYYAPDHPLPQPESDFLRTFDLVISFLHDPDGALRSNWERAGARRVLGVSPQVTAGHAVDHFLSVLEPLGMKCTAPLHLIDPAFVAAMDGHALSRPSSAAGAMTHRLERAIPYALEGISACRLNLPPALQAAGRARLQSFGLPGSVIAIHPGSGSPKKNWPLQSFLALAAKVQKAGLGQVLWLAGEADAGIVRALEALEKYFAEWPRRSVALQQRASVGMEGDAVSRPSVQNQPDTPGAGPDRVGAPILQGCDLPIVAAVLSQCRGYVGNDSGITHLAAAVGVPTVALFGPTDPDAWGPRAPRVSIVRARPPTTAGLAALRVAAVFDALSNL